jgi:hypothetical protein
MFHSRGNYFAAKSSCSHKYRYDSTKSTDPLRPRGEDGEFEMFYVRLLVGKEYQMAKNQKNEKLTCPPIDPASGTKRLKFNTVNGNTLGRLDCVRKWKGVPAVHCTLLLW